MAYNKEGFTIVKSITDNINVLIEFDNYRFKRSFKANSYNKETKKEGKSKFSKESNRKLSIKQIEKIYNCINNINTIQEFKEYFINDLNLIKEVL